MTPRPALTPRDVLDRGLQFNADKPAPQEPLRNVYVRGDRVWIARDPAVAAVGSIIVPDRARTPALTGVVVAAGTYTRTLAVGDRVAIPFGEGVVARYGGHDYLTLHEDQVLGVIR